MSKATQKILFFSIITLLMGTMMFSINNATAYNEVGNQPPQNFDFASDATTEAITITWDESNDIFLEASVIVNPPDGYEIISTEIFITLDQGEGEDEPVDDGRVWGFDPHPSHLFQVEIDAETNAHFDELTHIGETTYLVEIDEQEAGDTYKIQVVSKFGSNSGGVHITKEAESESVVLIEGMVIELDTVEYFSWEDAESDYPEKIHIPEKAGDPYVIQNLDDTKIRLMNADNFLIIDCDATNWERMDSFMSFGGCDGGYVEMLEINDKVPMSSIRAIYIKECENIGVIGAQITGFETGIAIKDSEYVSILSSNFKGVGAGGSAIKVKRGNNIFVYDNTISEYETGIEAINTNPEVLTIEISDNEAEDGQTWLKLKGNVKGKIHNNYMVDFEGSITVENNFEYENSKTTITLNIIENSITGIQIKRSKNVEAEDNIITNARTGIVMHTLSEDNIVDGNTITETLAPIQVVGSSHNIIRNNDIVGGIRGIYIKDRSSNNQIIGNTITDTIEAGVYLLDRCDENVIEGNTIQSSEVYGIRLRDECDKNEIIDNLVEDTGKLIPSGWYGFSVKIDLNSEYNIVEGNTIIGKFITNPSGDVKPQTPYGIHISGHSNYATITNNKVEKHAIGNLLIIKSGHTDVWKNSFYDIGKEWWETGIPPTYYPPAHIIQWDIPPDYEGTNHFDLWIEEEGKFYGNYYDNYYGLSAPEIYDEDGDGIAGHKDDSGVYHHFPYINWTYKVKDDYPLMEDTTPPVVSDLSIISHPFGLALKLKAEDLESGIHHFEISIEGVNIIWSPIFPNPPGEISYTILIDFNPWFTIIGTHTVDIEVFNGYYDGHSESATISGTFESYPEPYKVYTLAKIQDLSDAVLEVDRNGWDRNPAQRAKAMTNKLKATYVMVNDQDWDTVKSKMLGDIRPKLAGVKADGSDWKNVWITNPTTQEAMLSRCNEIIAVLELLIEDPNEPPVADAGSDIITWATPWVLLDARNSYDPDISNFIVSWVWDFYYPGQGDIQQTGELVFFAFWEVGVYYITLTVTDSIGATDTDELIVTVLPFYPE